MKMLFLSFSIVLFPLVVNAGEITAPQCKSGVPYIATGDISEKYETGCILPDGTKEIYETTFNAVQEVSTPAQLKQLAIDIDKAFLSKFSEWKESCTSSDQKTYPHDRKFCNVYVGLDSGFGSMGNRNILLGNHINTPYPKASGFVNIANQLCFWRDTGKIVGCPNESK